MRWEMIDVSVSASSKDKGVHTTEEIKCPVKEENKALFDYYFLMYLYRQKEDICSYIERLTSFDDSLCTETNPLLK